MKKALLIFGFCLLLLGLQANELDESLAGMFDLCVEVEHNGLNYLVADEFLVSESEAYRFVAWCSSLMLAEEENWGGDSSAYSSRINAIDGVGAAWSTDYQDFVVSIPLSEIYSQFGDGSYESFDELMAEVREYLENYGDVGNFLNFEN